MKVKQETEELLRISSIPDAFACSNHVPRWDPTATVLTCRGQFTRNTKQRAVVPLWSRMTSGSVVRWLALWSPSWPNNVHAPISAYMIEF